MTDLILKGVDPALMERIRRLSMARGWTRHQTCVALLEHGLFSSELEVRSGFQQPEVKVLADAIEALKAMPPGTEY